MSDEGAAGRADESDESDEDRRHRVDRRTTIDLTRAERGEPERRRLPGVDRRDNPDSQDR
ncbi:hypothetical protein AB2L28_16985 [Kineococcus sp. TBRC 1896]|uniref:Uncharacterized protein n=1 Tax=Kineococcus mangrovi TaxID=1660183 RepID=A0ABV4I873_9ACTN